MNKNPIYHLILFVSAIILLAVLVFVPLNNYAKIIISIISIIVFFITNRDSNFMTNLKEQLKLNYAQIKENPKEFFKKNKNK